LDGYYCLAVRRETQREQAGLPGDHSLRSAHLNPGAFDDGSLQLRTQIGRQTNRDSVSQRKRLNLTLRSIHNRAYTAAVSRGGAHR
jgi:hypothetical protein